MLIIDTNSRNYGILEDSIQEINQEHSEEFNVPTCPECGSPVMVVSHCVSCPTCGFSLCSL